MWGALYSPEPSKSLWRHLVPPGRVLPCPAASVGASVMSRLQPTGAAPPPIPHRPHVGRGGGRSIKAGPGPAPSTAVEAVDREPMRAQAINPTGPVGVGGVLPVVLAQPIRNGPLSLELCRGAAEARQGGLALSKRLRIAGHVRAFRCAVVPRRGFYRVAPACRVLGLEARHHGCPVRGGCR